VANDYLFIVCDCGKYIRIANYYPSMALRLNCSGDEIAAWLMKHFDCNDNALKEAVDLHGRTGFKIVTEGKIRYETQGGNND